MSRTLQLAEQLISRPSVTPDDAGCQQILGERLAPLGFTLETIESGPADFRVTNLWAVRRPTNAAATKTLVFAGHTDVVPTGPVEQWTSHPFTPTHRDGKLYGRGACDMKTSVAAFVTSIEEFLQAVPDPQLTLAFCSPAMRKAPASTAPSSSATRWPRAAKSSTTASSASPRRWSAAAT